MSLYNGAGALVLREIPGWAFYFGIYVVLKDFFQLNAVFERPQDHSWWQFLLICNCGGVAGMVSWVVSYPFDIINTVAKCHIPALEAGNQHF